MTPQEASEKRYELSVEYARLSEQLEHILLLKDEQWNEMRKQVKSVAEANRMWGASELGKQELHLTMAIKRNEKLSQGFTAIIRMKENEAKGIW